MGSPGGEVSAGDIGKSSGEERWKWGKDEVERICGFSSKRIGGRDFQGSAHYATVKSSGSDMYVKVILRAGPVVCIVGYM